MESIRLTVFYEKIKANHGHFPYVFSKISREAKHIRIAAFSNKYFWSYFYFVDFLGIPSSFNFLSGFIFQSLKYNKAGDILIAFAIKEVFKFF